MWPSLPYPTLSSSVKRNCQTGVRDGSTSPRAVPRLATLAYGAAAVDGDW
jgi:hypothetical protein